MRKKYQKKIIEKCTEAITFARVSSEKQERGASIDAQKELIYEYCMEKNLKIIKEFEITESTTRGDRVKYNEMLDFIRSRNKKTAIVVNCVDRLQRSDEDNPALNKLRREGKIEIHFMKEHIILDETSPVQDIFAWKMNVLMAGNYTDSLSYNVKRSLVKNWNSGKWQGMAPLGYLNRHTDDDNNEAIIIVDPVRAPIITHLFEEFATGKHTLKTLWYLSKELGLYTKNKKKKGCFVSRNTLYDVLTNPFYHGLMCIKGEFYNHIYEPLISKELFDRVQAILTGNGNHNRNNTTEYAKTPYTFRGLIHCKECGGLITPATAIKKNGSKYKHLRCANYKKCCHQAAVMEYVIFEQLENEVLNKLSLFAKMQELLKEQIIHNLNDTATLNTTIKNNVTKKINELKIKEDKLLDFYLEGKLTQDIYDIKKVSIDKEIKDLEETKKKYKIFTNDTRDKIVNIFSLAGNISYIFQHASPTRKNELLKMLLQDCQLNGKRLEYTLRKPFDKLINNHNIKSWSNIAVETIEEIC